MPPAPSRPRSGVRGTGAAALLAVALLASGCTGGSAAADNPTTGMPPGPDHEREAGLDRTAVLSPVAFRPVAPVVPVVGSDGRRHYAYELTVVNQSAGTATLRSIQAETPNRIDVGAELRGESLAPMFRVNGSGADGTTLPPGGSGTVFLDLSTDPSAPVPAQLEHQITLSYVPASTGKAKPKAQDLRLFGVPVTVEAKPPVVVAPPLRGAGWVVGNGCCSPVNAHRGSTLSINGTVSVAQRFAVDLVQLTDTRRAVTGDPAQVSSYPAFGKTVHAAAAGTVVGRRDGEKEQKPGSLPAGATIQNADGNYLVVDIGDDRYAFYAHLQPGSVKPKLGERVEVGAELGLLGNTGNTDAPHLHFHIMDGPSPLRSNGLPFVFDTFEGQGVLPDIDSLGAPEPDTLITVDKTQRAGEHRDQMPLGADLLKFVD